MDVEEARRVLFNRVQSFDSENAFKIMGYLLLQDWEEQEMLRLALGSDVVLHSLVAKAKKELGLTVRNGLQLSGQPLSHFHLESSNQPALQFPIQQSAQVSSFMSEAETKGSVYAMQQPKLITNNDHTYFPFFISNVSHKFPVPGPATPLRSSCFNEQLQDTMNQNRNHTPAIIFSPDSSGQQYLPTTDLTVNNREQKPLSHLSTWSLPSHGDASLSHLNPLLAWKPCLYFARGYCKHGSSCRFLHTSSRENTSSVYLDDIDSKGDEIVLNATLDILEKELKELLWGRKTPVSIASLPQLYYEKFGKTLQAEGYLTESQRHGKTGYSLTKLLAKLKHSVTLIDRPHGQHAVILTEDAHKFIDLRSSREDITGVNASSRQIYLTFPPESTFTEDDVTIHFRAYGPVQDVRIPYQQKRMFGFVTFIYPETVKMILAEGNPHYICGSRVLVKPYKEKGKLGDRRTLDRAEHLRYIAGFGLGRQDLAYAHVPKYLEHDRPLRNNEEECILALERRIAELRLSNAEKEFAEATPVTTPHQQSDHSFTQPFNVDDVPLSPEDCFHLQSNTFGYVLEVLEGEGEGEEEGDIKENDVNEGAGDTDSSVDPQAPNTSFVTTSAIVSTKLETMKTSSESSLLAQYNWSTPTLFARSVF